LLPSMLVAGYDIWHSIWYAMYYAAMAFTNTGFSPNPGGLAPFEHDYWMLSWLMIAVFLGGLGFPVIFALARGWRNPHRWSVHVKLTIATTTILFVFGAAMFLLLENHNPKTYGSMDFAQTAYQSFFMSAMTRSGGFSTINMHDLYGSSMLVSSMLMF